MENLLWLRQFGDAEEHRLALLEFRDHYNQGAGFSKDMNTKPLPRSELSRCRSITWHDLSWQVSQKPWVYTGLGCFVCSRQGCREPNFLSGGGFFSIRTWETCERRAGGSQRWVITARTFAKKRSDHLADDRMGSGGFINCCTHLRKNQLTGPA